MSTDTVFNLSIFAPPLPPTYKHKLESAFFSTPLPGHFFERGYNFDFFVSGFTVSNGFQNIPVIPEPLIVNDTPYFLPPGYYTDILQLISALKLPAGETQIAGPEIPLGSFVLTFRRPPGMIAEGFWAFLLNRVSENQTIFKVLSLGRWSYKTIFLECEGIVPAAPDRPPFWIVNGVDRPIVAGFNEPIPMLNPLINTWQTHRAQDSPSSYWRGIELFGKTHLNFKIVDEDGHPVRFFERYVSLDLHLRRTPLK